MINENCWTALWPAADSPTSDGLPGTPRVVYVRGNLWLDRPAGDPVARGLAGNPAAPIDVLLRLLDNHAEAVPAAFRRRADLPPAVVAAATRHPIARVRGALAANPHVDPAIRLRLLDDPERRVFELLLEDPDLELPDGAFMSYLDRLVKQFRRDLMTPAELHGEVIEVGIRDRRAVRSVATHPEPLVRAAAVKLLGSLDETSRAQLREALLHDDVPEVRAATVHFHAERERVQEPADLPANGYAYRGMLSDLRLSPALIEYVLADRDGRQGADAMATNPTLPPEVVEALFDHPSADVRRSLAQRDDLTRTQLARLAADPDVSVRTAVSIHPALSEMDRAAIDIDVTTAPWDRRTDHCWHIRSALPPQSLPPPAESVRLATSVNPLLRRRAAVDPRLPADVVAMLVDDPDPNVRALLAHHHPAAPPELLLRVFREDEHRRCDRGRLLALPNFPVATLAGYADDQDPAVRRLIALDPEADPSLVDRLTHDPDASVRHAMAACPQLPVDRIIELLDHHELAESAAANPALSVQVMRERVASTAPEGDEAAQ
ncbi:HEAT repeat domain-containing protein [Micromonospora sp. CA-249363]|uniref:HEAT repeat domain-containing protein n=1 Tax=Micromonospora sp. CA-249363 TaxID=3239963 RepID=UPI003D8C2DF9